MSENISIGLDIDERSVKFIKIKKTDSEASLLKYAVREIPHSEDKIKSVSDILKGLFKGERSDTEVHACAFGTNVSLKRLTIPVMPDEEIADALKWKAKSLIPFPLESSAIDFYKIVNVSDKAAEKYDIMFAAAGEEALDFLNSASKESGITFSGISLIPFALCSLLVQNNKIENNKINAVIDIGAESASINLFKGDTLDFTREITIAGDSFTKSMTGFLVADQWQLNLTYEQAEEIKRKYGIPIKDTTEVTDGGIPLNHIYEMITPTLRRLQNEILRSFDYYKEEFREEKIDRIFLTGGGSSLKNLEESLSNALGIKVETIDPFENIKIDLFSGIDAADLKKVSPRLALAVGLALAQSEKINFRRSKEKPRRVKIPATVLEKAKINIPANIIAWSAASILILAIIYYFYLVGIGEHYKKELATKQATASAGFSAPINDDKRAESYFAQGYLYYLEKSYDQAIPEFIKALKLKPAMAKSRYWMAKTYYQLGRYRNTVNQCNSALSIIPNYTNAKSLKARAQKKLGMKKSSNVVHVHSSSKPARVK